MKSEDIISFVLTHKNEEKIPYLREHIAHILNYLVSVPKFSPERANQFIIFALECITDACNGVTLEQFDLFKAAAGVQFSYEDLKNYFDSHLSESHNKFYNKCIFLLPFFFYIDNIFENDPDDNYIHFYYVYIDKIFHKRIF